jgi:hypothetical protein
MIANAYRSFAIGFGIGFVSTTAAFTTFDEAVVGSLKTDRDALDCGDGGGGGGGGGCVFISTGFDVRQDRVVLDDDDSFELFPFFITAVYYIILRLKYNIFLLSK